MPWAPTEIITYDWGRLQVIINDVDVTYFRDVPCQVISTEFNEPFGDGPAQIRFPQITSFEAVPTWLVDFANVEINRVDVDGEFVENIWEGLYISQGDSLDNGATLDLTGALYQADFYKKPPSFDLDARDIGLHIASLLNPKINNYGLRLSLMTPVDTGLFMLNRGSWQNLLTGYIQDILATAHTITDLGKGIAVGLTPRPNDQGYWITGSEGMVLTFGDAQYHGSRAHLALNQPISGMTASLSGNGYWLVAGDGGVFTYGDAVFYGSLGDLALNEPVVEIERTETGEGYWLVAEDGGVFTFGDAEFFGNAIGDSEYPIVDMTATPSGNGYWLLNRLGEVFSFGDAIYAGNADNSDDPLPILDPTPTGLVTAGNLDIHRRPIARIDGVISTVRSITVTLDATHHVLLPTVSPQATIWTDRQAIDHYRETGEHLGIFNSIANADAYAEALHLQQEAEYSPERIWVAIERHGDDGYWLLNSEGKVEAKGSATNYGDMIGTPLNKVMHDMSAASDGNGYWLMAEDGGVFTFSETFWGSVPEYNGTTNQYTLTKVAPRTPVLRLKDKTTIHWEAICGTPGITHDLQRDLLMSPNCLFGEGIGADGCHWRNSRYPDDETIDSAFFLPLARLDSVEPFVYNADGSVVAPNPSHNPNQVRVEDYENMGDQLTFREGVHSARAKIIRDAEPGWFGTITLESDPIGGSRLNIRAGQNILFKAHRGADRLYHIAKVAIDWVTLKVVLTVDTKYRDLMTIAAMLTRDRELSDPTKRPKPTRHNSKLIEDRVAVFDCEAGAGILKPTGRVAQGWTVQRVAFAERGTIMKTEISTEPPIEFAMAIFDKAWSPSSLAARMPDGPFSYDEDGLNPWDSWTDEDGLIMAWGGVEQPAGYSPELKNPDNDITGDLIDTSSWYYESKAPPWLWVAVFHEEDGTVEFSGKFTPGILAAN